MSSSNVSHKPRKKRKDLTTFSTGVSQELVVHDDRTNAAKPAFPLVAFFWPGRGATSQWVILPSILMAVGLFRWTIGLWGFSGNSSLELTLKSISLSQVSTNPQCTATLKLSVTGWRSPITCQSHHGTSMTCNTGVWTTHP